MEFQQTFRHVFDQIRLKLLKYWFIVEDRIFKEVVEQEPSEIIDDHRLSHLSSVQKKMLLETFHQPLLREEEIQRLAEETQVDLLMYTVYQFHEATNWQGQSQGKPIDQMIARMIKWRKEYGIHEINLMDYSEIFDLGVAYTPVILDRNNQSIIYLKPGNMNHSTFSSESYNKLLMYCVERSDRLALTAGSNQFSVIIDMDKLTFSKYPIVQTIVDVFQRVATYYPNKLDKIIIFNSGNGFFYAWRVILPFLSKKSAAQVQFVAESELNKLVGLDMTEILIGQAKKTLIDDYLRSGYWEKRRLESETK